MTEQDGIWRRLEIYREAQRLIGETFELTENMKEEARTCVDA